MKKTIVTLISLFVGFHLSAQKLPEFTDIISNQTTTVKNQGKTGTCWSFSATSFIESEMMRQGYDAFDISEMYIVRNIYLEKAERYIRKQGKSNFSQGALAHDLINGIEKYGIIPEEHYSGKNGKDNHDHSEMVKELKSYLDSMVMNRNIDLKWKDSFNHIMDKYMGEVPASFKFYDQTTNPSLLLSMFPVKSSDYVGLTSFLHHPYNSWFAIEVPDNFSEGPYYNVRYNKLFQIMDEALKNGFTIEWDGDVSEPGFKGKLGVAVLADINEKTKWPIKEDSVDVIKRQEAFDTYATTDDHLMHIVGLAKDEHGTKYYKVKNSWSEKNGIDGYVYMSEAYMKMKTVSIYLPKAALPKDMGI
jgi:bleomycin hydrolase